MKQASKKRALVLPATLVVSVLGGFGLGGAGAITACSSSPAEPKDCFCEAVDAGQGPDAGPSAASCTGPEDPKFKDPYWSCGEYA